MYVELRRGHCAPSASFRSGKALENPDIQDWSAMFLKGKKSMTDNTPQKNLEQIALRLDNGAEIAFAGRQFAGGSWYDEETGVLTRQNLYITDSSGHVYSIVSGRGQERSRRAYKVALQGETCVINDGHTEMTLELEMLMLAVRALTGLDKEDAPTLDMVEETLRAANC